MKSKKNESPSDRMPESVESVAYSIWESEGRPEGRSFEHWIRAEIIVSGAGGVAAESEKPAAKKPGRAKSASSKVTSAGVS